MKSNNNLRTSAVILPIRARHGSGFEAYRLNDSQFDGLMNPILNIDHFFMSQPTFPPHPHAGFSAVTYMFDDSETGFLNRDSRGDVVEINGGDLHWTQAGRGILHEETPIQPGLVSHGLQIFVNLPRSMKSGPAKVLHLKNAKTPRTMTKDGSAEIKVVVGKYESTSSPVQSDWPLDLIEVIWNQTGIFEMKLAPGEQSLVHSIGSQLSVEAQQIEEFGAIALANETTEDLSFTVSCESKGRAVVFRSRPILEPVYFQGPFVATSVAEMSEVIKNYKTGSFGTLLPRNYNS